MWKCPPFWLGLNEFICILIQIALKHIPIGTTQDTVKPNISRTLVGNKIVDHSDVVGASPDGAAPSTPSFFT